MPEFAPIGANSGKLGQISTILDSTVPTCNACHIGCDAMLMRVLPVTLFVMCADVCCVRVLYTLIGYTHVVTAL